MRHVDEYRDPDAVKAVARQIHETATGPWTLMEVCGGQTHSILKFGLDQLLPREVSLVHGPGCPVCVTPLEMIDRAVAIASRDDVVFCSFGDMLRVPGSETDLLKVKANGGDVRIVYSPLDAVRLARENPGRKVVFFAVGFETTAPANAMAVSRAAAEGLENFSVLVAHVLVPPALEALLSSDDVRIQGLLAPGHVCAVTGYRDYEPLAERYGVPIVVTGFEPLDLLKGVLATVGQLERGEARVENQYPRAVVREGNALALRMIEDVFVVSDRSWRGVGEIPRSGLHPRPEVRPVRRRAGLRRGRPEGGGARGVPERAGPPGPAAAHRVPGVRHPLHPGAPPRGHHGLHRGGLRRVLPLRPGAPREGGREGRRDREGGGAPELSRRPSPTATSSSSPTAAGGTLTSRLIDTMFVPAFRNAHLDSLGDGAVLEIGGVRLAFTTDSFVVKPVFFPGGDIGSLAVHGTVNDLAMCGAEPLYLSAGLILEEGFPMADLERVVTGMAEACRRVGVSAGHRRHQGGGPGQGRRDLREHRRRGTGEGGGRRSVPPGPRSATRSWSRGRWGTTASR